MSSLAEAKAHYLEEEKSAKERAVIAVRILRARKSEIDAKLLISESLKVKLDKTDILKARQSIN